MRTMNVAQKFIMLPERKDLGGTQYVSKSTAQKTKPAEKNQPHKYDGGGKKGFFVEVVSGKTWGEINCEKINPEAASIEKHRVG